MIADLHSHPTRRVYESDSLHTPVQEPDVKPALKSEDAQIHFAFLSPAEKGFFQGVQGGTLTQSTMQQFCECLARRDNTQIKKWITDHALASSRSGINKFDWLNALSDQISQPAVDYVKCGQYDYFEELKRQYRLFRVAEREGNCSLAVPGENLSTTHNDLTKVVLAINGIHSLGIGNPEDECMQDGQPRLDISLGRLKSRIHQIKGEEPLDDPYLSRWQHPPMMVRLAHHFGNGIFGHARSLPENAKMLFDQTRNLNKGIIKVSGYEIVRELLGLDEALRPTGSRRILIDMLHLSAASRNNLYEQVYRIYNKNINPTQPIPVIFTGAAYSGIDYLIEMIRNGEDGREGDDQRVNGYYGGSINLSDEDVLAVFWSNGLIALTLEECRLGDEMGGIEKVFSNSPRRKAMRLLSRQIAGIISIPFAYHLAAPLNIWNCLSIGPGLGNRTSLVAHYRNQPDLKILQQDVEEVLFKLKRDEPMWFGGFKPSQLAEKICSENVREFTALNFR